MLITPPAIVNKKPHSWLFGSPAVGKMHPANQEIGLFHTDVANVPCSAAKLGRSSRGPRADWPQNGSLTRNSPVGGVFCLLRIIRYTDGKGPY